MKKLFAKTSIIALATLNQVQVSASEGKTAGAIITCSGKGESELTFANGQIQFPDNFQPYVSYVSYVSKITGTMSLTLPSEKETSSFNISGYYIGSEYGHREHWIMLLDNDNQEFGKLILSRDMNNDEYAYGNIDLKTGQEYSAICKIILNIPSKPTDGALKHCNPHGC